MKVKFSITIPSTGFAYVNQHLDDGLKGPQVDKNGDGIVQWADFVVRSTDFVVLSMPEVAGSYSFVLPLGRELVPGGPTPPPGAAGAVTRSRSFSTETGENPRSSAAA